MLAVLFGIFMGLILGFLLGYIWGRYLDKEDLKRAWKFGDDETEK